MASGRISGLGPRASRASLPLDWYTDYDLMRQQEAEDQRRLEETSTHQQLGPIAAPSISPPVSSPPSFGPIASKDAEAAAMSSVSRRADEERQSEEDAERERSYDEVKRLYGPKATISPDGRVVHMDTGLPIRSLTDTDKAIQSVVGPHGMEALMRGAEVSDTAINFVPVVGDAVDMARSWPHLWQNIQEGDTLGTLGWGTGMALDALPLVAGAGSLLGSLIPMAKKGHWMSPDDLTRLSRAETIWDAAKAGRIDDIADSMKLSPEIVTAAKSSNMMDDLARAIAADPDVGFYYLPNEGGANFWKEVGDFELKDSTIKKLQAKGAAGGKVRTLLKGETLDIMPEVGDTTMRLEISGGEGGGGFTPRYMRKYAPPRAPHIEVNGPLDSMPFTINHELTHAIMDTPDPDTGLGLGSGGGNPSRVPSSLWNPNVKKPDRFLASLGLFGGPEEIDERFRIYTGMTGENAANAVGNDINIPKPRTDGSSLYDSMYQKVDEGKATRPLPDFLKHPRALRDQAFSSEVPGGKMVVGTIGPDGEIKTRQIIPIDEAAHGSGAHYLSEAYGEAPQASFGPRVRRGKISGLGDYPTTDPNYIAAQTLANDGYSVNIPTGQVPEDGLMMGMYPRGSEGSVAVPGHLTPEDVSSFYGPNRNRLKGEDKYLGTWYDDEAGETYIDVAKRWPPEKRRAAIKAGERAGQISGYDIAAGAEFPVGNWEDFVHSPEFRARMNEMAEYGGEFLDQYPTRQWWNMPGTSIEEVYGPRIDRMAGFTAATAPNSQPEQNLQVASEYMRRYIKGEPALQPDWRVGDSGGPPMSRKPGGKLGIQDETKPLGNIGRAERGEPLSGYKVESERRAMMGDPEAVVLDRHQARLAEDPSRGILIGASEGEIPDEAYPVLEQVFRDEAHAKGTITPRDLSADVWTGTRETIKNTGELYGTPYRASAIRGESKAYADVFTDLINEKSRFLGITPQEMKARLRAGDANLLEVLPFIPGGMILLRMMAGQSEEEAVQ